MCLSLYELNALIAYLTPKDGIKPNNFCSINVEPKFQQFFKEEDEEKGDDEEEDSYENEEDEDKDDEDEDDEIEDEKDYDEDEDIEDEMEVHKFVHFILLHWLILK